MSYNQWSNSAQADSLDSPGFRNPWYSPNSQFQNQNLQVPQLPNGANGGLQPHQQMPILGLSKKHSFANQLPVTYELDAQQSLPSPYDHPPTRADNPFNQYYTNQEVSLSNFPDRRMSAAVDGPVYSPYHMQNPAMVNNHAHGAVAPPENPSSYAFVSANNMPASARRSSVALGSGSYQNSNSLNKRFMSPQISPQMSFKAPNYGSAASASRITPRAVRVKSKADLRPQMHNQPKYRRRSVNSIHISPTNALSVYLTESYSMCQPQKFSYSKTSNPRRVLTKPSEPKFNNGLDNEDGDYILYVNDMLGAEEGRKYVVLDLLGSGTFGQVVKCQNLANQSTVAVKVVKSKSAYLNQSLLEVKILEFLNRNVQSNNFIRLLDTFMHREHLCLVFEILGSNLYELIKQNQFHGLNMKLVKSFTKQLLESCLQLKNLSIIHCDLKPENILLCSSDKPDIKVIDFGSACFTQRTIYSYIQSRFYRSPEVILGLPYTEAIDMWSLGCTVGELFLGLPMFPGSSEYNQILKIVDMMGNPPRHMLEHGRNSLNFFEKLPSTTIEGKSTYKLKSYEQYVEFLRREKANAKEEQPNKNYFDHRHLEDIILNYKMPSKKMTQSMIDHELKQRKLLVDFLLKVLNLDPLERMTPSEALKHPFVSGIERDDH